MSKTKIIAVSACLVGYHCRYDGDAVAIEDLKSIVDKGKAIPLCPEVLGGLNTPRLPCEIKEIEGGQRVVNIVSEDVTEAFVDGAKKCLDVCKVLEIETAVLKSRSPSCGCGNVYDGSFTGTLKKGNGLTAELLIKNGIQVFNEENFNPDDIDS